jgi:hypothetical protein
MPAPSNFALVVINGELGHLRQCRAVQQGFCKEWFIPQGARWKVRGNPGGQGTLKYLGDDPAAYKRIYTIKTKDDPKVWASFINLCKVLNETPADKLEQALAPLLDIDGALKFIALDNALINNDGYWIRTSDYSIYQDEKGRFHIIPQDVNETFVKPGGPGLAVVEAAAADKEARWAAALLADDGWWPGWRLWWWTTNQRRRTRSVAGGERPEQTANLEIAGCRRCVRATRLRPRHCGEMARLEQARAHRRTLSLVDCRRGKGRHTQVGFHGRL